MMMIAHFQLNRFLIKNPACSTIFLYFSNHASYSSMNHYTCLNISLTVISTPTCCNFLQCKYIIIEYKNEKLINIKVEVMKALTFKPRSINIWFGLTRLLLNRSLNFFRSLDLLLPVPGFSLSIAVLPQGIGLKGKSSIIIKLK